MQERRVERDGQGQTMGKQGDNMLRLQEERRGRKGREGVTLCSSCMKSSAGKPTQARNTFIMH